MNSNQGAGVLEAASDNPVRRVRRRLERLASILGDGELLADTLAADLRDLERAHSAIPGNEISGGALQSKQLRVERFGDKALMLLAQAGMSSFEMKRHPNGVDVPIRIDGRQRFVLKPALAHLVALLAMDVGESDDDLVPFKSLELLADLLAKEEKRHVSLRAVTQRIYRLRAELLETGRTNPFFVMTDPSHPSRGARLALPRKLAPGGGLPRVVVHAAGRPEGTEANRSARMS